MTSCCSLHLLPRRISQSKAIARAIRSSSTSGSALLNIAVVGSGRMGGIRCANVYGNPATKLSCIVDLSVAREKLASTYNTKSYESLETALERNEVDAVWIATPTPTHKKLITVAAAAGKAVAVEKPVAATVADIAESHAMCKEHGVPLFCSFQRRTDESYVALAQAVQKGGIGKVHSVHATFRDHPVPEIEFLKLGGDIFHDLAIHDVDFVRWILGEDPYEVYATMSSHLPELKAAGVADAAHALFRFPSGVVFTLEMTRACNYGYDNRMEVTGAGGMAEVVNRPRLDVVRTSEQGRVIARPEHSFPQRFAEAYRAEVERFVAVARGLAEPPVSCDDSLLATHIAEMASRSAQCGQPVQIDYGALTAIRRGGSSGDGG